MRLKLSVSFDIFRDPKPAATPDEPDAPTIYDVSSANIERRRSWDHDTKPPIGFTRQETT